MRCNLHDADIMEDGIAIGEARGEARGEERAKLEAARNMLKKELLSLEDISEYSGLPLETVQQLAEQLKAEPVQTN